MSIKTKDCNKGGEINLTDGKLEEKEEDKEDQNFKKKNYIYQNVLTKCWWF